MAGGSLDNGGSYTLTIPVNATYNTITILSMIAPSSDWIVSKRILLYENNSFKTSGTIELSNYDAGTEKDDKLFSLGNEDENPKKNISDLVTPFKKSDVLVEVHYTQSK